MGLPCHAKVAHACAGLQSKAKKFHQVYVPQPGGGRRLRTFKNADNASMHAGS
jgi:hypothetical protein